MASKFGLRDLRCNEAVLATMLVHPRYRRDIRFVDRGIDMVKRGNWAVVAYLPRDAAREALVAVSKEIVKNQKQAHNCDEGLKPARLTPLLKTWI